MADLLYAAYKSYDDITNKEIEERRLRLRLKVVQGVEDQARKNVIKAVADSTKLEYNELAALFDFVKDEQLYLQHRGAVKREAAAVVYAATEMAVAAVPAVQTQSVNRSANVPVLHLDYEGFLLVFRAVSNWGNADVSNDLARRIFTVSRS